MACYHPLRIFYTGRKTETGKSEGIVTQGFLDRLLFEDAVKQRPGLKLEECKGLESDAFGHAYLTNHEDIPCGNCLGCKIEYAEQWATRLMLEAKDYAPNNWFLTLTYDDQHYPKDGKLSLHELQKFFKRLRKKYGEGLRIAHSGEYGTHTGRAHYHAIILGLKLTDLKRWNDTLQYSPDINKIWGKGNVMIGNVTHDSCAYVAKYTLKKHDQPDSWFHTSRRPGIGAKYYQKHGEIFANGCIYHYDNKLIELSIPKYYKRKFKEDDPETAEYLKNVAKESSDAVERNLIDSYQAGNQEKMLSIKERMAEHGAKRNKRKL